MNYLNMEFESFCNICFKNKNLRKLEENEHVLKILISFIGYEKILLENDIYLCSDCCEKLESYLEFKDMCLKNLINLRLSCIQLKEELQKYNDCDIEIKLNNYINNAICENLYESKQIKTEEIVCTDSEDEKNEFKLKIENEYERNSDDIFWPASENEFVKEETYSDEDTYEVKPSVSDKLGDSFTSKTKDDDYPATINIQQNPQKYGDLQSPNKKCQYTCNICEKNFLRPYLLKKHLLNHSDDVKRSYACDVCQKTFLSVKNLNSHKYIHEKEKFYTCNICQKSFKKSYLKLHQLIHSDKKPYTCNVCKQEFTRPTTLRDHARIHTGEKPFSCNVCKKEFRKLQYLRLHERFHTGEKPYKCNICQKTFAHKSNFNIHQRSHRDKKPYVCTCAIKNFVNHVR